MAIGNYHRLEGKAKEDADKEMGSVKVEPEEPKSKRDKK